MTFELAAASYEGGDLRGAWDACVALFDERNPDHRLLHLMGLIAFRQQHITEARSLLERATALAPDDPLYLCNLALPDFAQNDLPSGIARLDLALGLKPDFVPALEQKASALMQLNRAREARPLLQELATKQPTPRRLMSLALCLRSLGQLDEARSCLRGLLTNHPDCGQAWWLLAGLGRSGKNANNLVAMADALAGELKDDDRVPLLFAMAKEHEDLGNYDEAFAFYREANELRRARSDYDIDKDAALFERIIANDIEKSPARRALPQDQAIPIFVVSMPRTGSTLLERILGSHSQVVTAGELQLIGQIIQMSSARSGKTYPESIAQTREKDYREMRELYLNKSRQWRDDSRFFVDKMPVNFLYLGQIAKMFPEAPLIHVHRNPVDTCLSCYRQLFGDFYQFAYDLAELGRWYVMYRNLMAHWQRLMPDRILNVEYESLVRDPEGQARSVLAHCGLDWEPACLDFTQGGTAVRTPSAEQVRHEIHQDSVGRWRRYERHLEPLLKALGDFSVA